MRFYTNIRPDKDDIIMAKITNINMNSGVIDVNILEYNILGNIFINNLGKKEKNIKKFLKLNKNNEFPCMVYCCDDIPDVIPLKAQHEQNIYKKKYYFFKHLEKLVTEFKFIEDNNDLDYILWDIISYYKNKEVSENEFSNFIQNTQILLDIFDNIDIINSFIQFIKNRIIYTNIVYGIDFKILVLSENSLEYLKKLINILCDNSYSVNYHGAPIYKIVLKYDSIEKCENQVQNIKNLLDNYIKENNIKSDINIINDSEEIKNKTVKLSSVNIK